MNSIDRFAEPGSGSRSAARVAVGILLVAGCSGRPQVVPVTGRVTLDGRPLGFGSVMIQPAAGPAARARIGSDGQFVAGTFAPGDGALVGPALVRVTCYEQQGPDARPTEGEASLGDSQIPERYTQFETSGITVTVAAGMEPLEIELFTRPPG